MQAALAEDAAAEAAESSSGDDGDGDAAAAADPNAQIQMERAETAESRVALSGSNNVPLRHLVYRVHKLPPSLRTYIYDFGSLSANVEKKYIELKIAKGLERLATKSIEKYETAAPDADDDPA